MKEDRLTKIYTFEPYFFKKKEVAFVELSKAIKYAVEDRHNYFKSLNLVHTGGRWIEENGIRRYKIHLGKSGTTESNFCAYINEIPLEDCWDGGEDEEDNK